MVKLSGVLMNAVSFFIQGHPAKKSMHEYESRLYYTYIVLYIIDVIPVINNQKSNFPKSNQYVYVNNGNTDAWNKMQDKLCFSKRKLI